MEEEKFEGVTEIPNESVSKGFNKANDIDGAAHDF